MKRDGSEIQRDSRTGNVLVEIVLGERANLSAVLLVSFASPAWPLGEINDFKIMPRYA